MQTGALDTRDFEQEEIRALHDKEKDLQQKIKGLEREIAAHKREIKYRDDTIGEKEKKIYELKKKKQEVRIAAGCLRCPIQDNLSWTGGMPTDFTCGITFTVRCL